MYVEYYQNDKTAEEAAAALGVERSTVNDAARRIRKKAAAIPFLHSYPVYTNAVCEALMIFLSLPADSPRPSRQGSGQKTARR